MTEQNEMLILKISLQQGGLHSFGWTPAHEWYHPQTVRRMLASVARQLAKISLSGGFFRREKLHFVNEISPQTYADSHEF